MKKVFYFLSFIYFFVFLVPSVFASNSSCKCGDGTIEFIAEAVVDKQAWCNTSCLGKGGFSFFVPSGLSAGVACTCPSGSIGNNGVEPSKSTADSNGVCQCEKKAASETTISSGSDKDDDIAVTTSEKSSKPACTATGSVGGIWEGLESCRQCGTCEFNDFLRFGVNISKYILGLVGSLAFLMFVYGGVMMLISAGSPERVKTGQKILVNAVIGLVIVLTSWLIVQFSYNLLGVKYSETFDPKTADQMPVKFE